MRSTRAGRAVAALVLAGSAAFPAFAHEAYLMNHNHTDYNWNAPAAAYDASMLAELDYYLQQIQSTSGNVSEEQSRLRPG